ncbi:D-Ala-D-Ala carboxypeptidase family metallohydrolase [Rhizobium rhizogenes]
MARAPVNQIPLSAQLQPVASPIDTFTQAGPSPLRGVADALGTVDKSLQQFLSIRDQKAEQDDALRGKAAFYQDSGGEFAKMVSEGKIPAQYSPFYVRGFKEAQGAAAGEALRSKWQDAWDNWDGKNSEDPKAFNMFFHDFVRNNVGSQDPDVLRGVLPTVEALQSNATTQYTQYRHDQTVNGSLTSHGALISGAVQDGVDAGLTEPKGADYPAIFANVDKVVSQQLATGDPGGKAVDTFIDVMSGKILETKDPKLLDWFNQKVPGQSYTYGQTPHGIEVKNATVNSLEVAARQQAAGLTSAEKQAMEKRKDEAQQGIISSILKDPNAPIPEEILTQGEQNGDPLIRLHAKQWRDDLVKGTSDPKKLTAFYDDVVSGRVPPKDALLQALGAGVFQSAEDMRAASAFVQSFQTSEDTITKALNGQVSRQVLEAIRQRTVAKDPTTMNPLAGTSDEGFEASSDFRQLVTRWVINNPNATLPEIEEQVQKFGKQITDRFQAPSDPFTEGATYGRDPNLPFGNPYDQPQAGEADTTQQGSADPDVKSWETQNKVTPEQRKIIEDQAARAGMGYDEFVRTRALKQNQSAPAGEGDGLINKISYDPQGNDLGEGERAAGGVTPEQASSYIDQAFSQAEQAGLSGDERTTNLLDLIGQGESGGNYNSVFGNPKSSLDLGTLSVNDILQQQEQARQAGIASTAVGKYGFIFKTLRGLKAEMGLSGDEKFTPKLQDQMGKALLNRRGLQAYQAGRISKKTFALSLSQEFAALPNPNTGRSFYAGDGLNAARVSRSSVYGALGFTPASYNPDASASSGPIDNLSFDHPEQAAGVKRQLLSAVSDVGRELGISPEIISGYRSPKHNAAVGGAKGSEHTEGNAVDVNIGGLSDADKTRLVQGLIAKGVKRFITYSNEPNMLHVDLKDQRGDGSPYFMHNKSARNLRQAPSWFQALALGTTDT